MHNYILKTIVWWIVVVYSVTGCKYHNKEHESGSEWIDEKDPCKLNMCSAGVLTHSSIQCRPVCREQIYKPGQCCPACSSEKENTKGCVVNGVTVENGKSIIKPGEKCTTCKCESGELTCTQKVCPVLNCPHKFQTHEENQCCPVCKGKAVTASSIHGSCLFRGHLHRERRHFMPDKCTKCSCYDGGMRCYRKACPDLNCPKEFLVFDKKSCCPKCKRPAGCAYKGQMYKIDQSWKDGSCTDCSCKDGKATCQKITCGLTPKCPQKSILYRPQGECCALCVPAHSVCSLTGSNKDYLSYASFDGFNFKFGGTCRYTLLQDVADRQINIRVKNEFHPYPTVRTKLVTIIVSSLSIGLHRDLDIRVNRSKIRVPYKHENFTIEIVKNATVVVNVINGFKLTWSKQGDIDVYVTPSWQDKLGGLCGNFNQVVQDDTRTKAKREIVSDAEVFAKSWRVGGKCNCDEPFNSKKSSCQTNDQRVRAHQKCDILKSPSFKKCHKKVPVKPFLRACTDNVCECPLGKNCECAIVKFYMRECAEHNINLKLPKKSACKPSTQQQHDSYSKKNLKKQEKKERRGRVPLLLRSLGGVVIGDELENNILD
ncbi:BMP-binding endothelial regulator protein-like [Tubulanus polymorphus]|uniref:BMP-binding endothelial regulator protein-like n=1 Tax=Tubulanus polymorphus TaxID=672921 RepID=UPI003DA3DEDA